MPATNPDGSYTTEFLLWEAELEFRVAVRHLFQTGRILAGAVGAWDARKVTPAIVGKAMLTAETDPGVARALHGWNAAQQALMDAAVARAELDPTFDIRPLLPA
jgi:hypothetical protein